MLDPNWQSQSYGQYNLQSQACDKVEYNPKTAKVITQVMTNINNMLKQEPKSTMASFLQTYSLNKGIKKFGHRGYNSTFREMLQLHQRTAFTPLYVNELIPEEKKRALESLIS